MDPEKVNEIYGDPGSDYEWASDVDSEGKPIWGEEGVDFEWYYQEDKESYERGEPTLDESMLLNRNQVSKDYSEEQNYADRYELLHAVKAKLAGSGVGEAVYRTKKKKAIVRRGPQDGMGSTPSTASTQASSQNGVKSKQYKNVGGGYKVNFHPKK